MIASFFWLTTCVYFEARGEPHAGQKAVAHVVLNRAENRKQSVTDVVTAPYQFSWANNGVRPPISDYNAFIRCAAAVKDAIDERLLGKTMDMADHYHATWIDPPDWAAGMDKIATIGQHIFYKSR